MAWGAILGSLIGAGGQLGGGALAASGQQKPSDQIIPSYNPALDYALQAQQFDALNQLGFGNIYDIPDPFQQLAGRISAALVDNKTKRRAFTALQNIMQDPSLMSDPFGTSFTRDEIYQANKTGAPFGRHVQKASESDGNTEKGAAAGAGAGAYFGPMGMALGAGIGALIGRGKDNDTKPVALPIKNIGRLQQALGAVGLSLSSIQDTVKRAADLKAQIKKLEDSGMGQMNTDAILGRYKAATEAARLAGGAANFIQSGGQASDPAMAELKAQDDYAMSQAMEKMGLMAQFGGGSQASVMRAMSQLQSTQNPRLVERALALSGALGGSLAGGQAANAANGNAGFNSAQLAAQQANALNSLRASTADAKYSSLANGTAGGSGSIGSDLANYSALQSQRAYNQQQTELNNRNMLEMMNTVFGNQKA